MTTLGEMSEMDLRTLITQMIDARLHELFGDFDFEVSDDDPEDTRSSEEVFADLDRHRWTPPPGSPSIVDLLRQDRDA